MSGDALDADAEDAWRRRATPTRATPAWAAPTGSAPAPAAVTAAPAIAVPATAVPPVGQLHMLGRVRSNLWCRSGVGDAGQSDGRKAEYTSDCTCTDNLLQGHVDPPFHVKLLTGTFVVLMQDRTLNRKAMNHLYPGSAARMWLGAAALERPNRRVGGKVQEGNMRSYQQGPLVSHDYDSVASQAVIP
jgi:hypothetical protein